jgi:hypothetical protein
VMCKAPLGGFTGIRPMLGFASSLVAVKPTPQVLPYTFIAIVPTTSHKLWGWLHFGCKRTNQRTVRLFNNIQTCGCSWYLLTNWLPVLHHTVA